LQCGSMRGLKFSSILEGLFGPPAPRFRTIQGCPMDLPTAPVAG
jgi:hypothetical protein